MQGVKFYWCNLLHVTKAGLFAEMAEVWFVFDLYYDLKTGKIICFSSPMSLLGKITFLLGLAMKPDSE